VLAGHHPVEAVVVSEKGLGPQLVDDSRRRQLAVRVEAHGDRARRQRFHHTIFAPCSRPRAIFPVVPRARFVENCLVAQRRIVVVDDDVWVRRGRAASLAEVPGLAVTAVLSHADALDFDQWDEADIALVDAWDERASFDRFPGVRVVEAIRARRSPAETLVVVVSGHVFDEMLRLRMAEAGADFFYSHADVRDLDALTEILLRPDAARRVTPSDAQALEDVGLTTASRPNATLRQVSQAGLSEAFAPGESQKALPISRRGIINARRRLADAAGLAHTGGPSERVAPEWRAIVRFVNWARGAERPQRR
jgi:DNA-binding NarL/FixJ family response regulator